MPFPLLPMAQERGKRFVGPITVVPMYEIDPDIAGYLDAHMTYLRWELTDIEFTALETYYDDTTPVWDYLEFEIDSGEPDELPPIPPTLDAKVIRLMVPPTKELLVNGNYRVHELVVIQKPPEL